MLRNDVIVIGGSTGCFAALQEICAGLPAEFPASIFIVVHISPDFSSTLDQIISRWGALPASRPSDGETIESGRIYVARPDYHLTIEDGKIRVRRGPRENRHRPAIDPLFRSAARVYRSRVIGILLSGLLDDGIAGLYAVKQRGGVAIVQEPQEAPASEMPRRALEYMTPHYVLRAAEIAPVLIRLVGEHPVEVMKKVEKPAGAASEDNPQVNMTTVYPEEGNGRPSVFACPECHGVLWEQRDNVVVRFRCRVGHAYGEDSLAQELSEKSEAALWAAMRALEEKAAMQRRIADAATTTDKSASRLRDQSSADDENARVIRQMLFDGAGAESEQESESDAKQRTA